VNPQIRFFPAEQEKYLPLIKDAEDKVFQLVQEAGKKLREGVMSYWLGVMCDELMARCWGLHR